MRRVAFLFVFWITNLVFVLGAMAQDKKPKLVTDYIPTENVEPGKESNTKKNEPNRKKIEYIYVNGADQILYGNPCVLENTRKMGFEYVLNRFGLPGSALPDDQFSNNLRVKFKLVFTQSPFWKLRLNRRIKKCRDVSGDFVG